MKVDASFAEFVSARWSTLYRLAALLVGEDDADRLTQDALVRAYLSWRDLQEPADTADLVKAILVRTAVDRPADATGAAGAAGPTGASASREHPEPTDRPLWTAITRLHPRQRAVLVLRHYEVLSDGEIAHLLKCPLETVVADTRALETGVDPSDLRDELVRRSHDVDVPLPPTEALVAAGHLARRRRTRRGLGWAAVVAAVLAVALAAANLVQAVTSDEPEPATSRPSAAVPGFLTALPRGDEPRVAYAVGRTLHVGGREVPLDGRPSAIVQTRHWVFVSYLSGAIVRVDPETGELVTVAADSRGELVTDPSGEHVAWLAAGPGPAVVVIQTVDAAGATLVSDAQEFPATPRCCDNPFVVNGITEQGTVVASLPAAGRAWVWATPDGGRVDAVRELAGLGNGAVDQVTVGGIAALYPPSHFAVGVLEGDTFFVRAELNARQADFADPLGLRVLYADDAGEIRVRDRAQRGRSRRPSPNVRLGLPALGQGYDSVRWEDADHVLLDVSDASLPQGALVRCDVDTGACEVTVRFDGPHLVAE